MLLTANIFQPLISVFAAVIKFFHNDVDISWGWSIVLLTVCVRLVLAPLAIKQVKSMRRMQHVQPQMKAIQQKYKQDKQRQQEEMMKFYKENDINPFASCLPLVAQLPVFISLFYMLRKNLRGDICPAIQHAYQSAYAKVYVTGGSLKGVTVAAHNVSKAAAHAAALGQTTACGHVNGAGFLFIKDITNQAHGVTLVVLMLLYVGTQLLSTLAMPMAPTMDKSQRNLMLIMPVAFVVFIFRFPAGLIVYWVTTNTWTMLQQFTIKRFMGPVPPPVALPVDSSGPSPRRPARGAVAGSAVIDVPDPTAGPGGGGVGRILRGIGGPRSAVPEPQPAAKPSGNGGPPPSARKKRKRSGRRR